MEELREFLEIIKEHDKNQWELLKIYKKDFGSENVNTQMQLARACESSNLVDALEEFIARKTK